MARKKEVVAMLLAGGQGTRLQVLTKDMAKPAVPFGGKYRIIDFPLSNCANSGISTVGVLTQFMPLELNSYMGNGQPWDLDRMDGGLSILPPYTAGKTGEWYKGTANAIYQNIKYIEHIKLAIIIDRIIPLAPLFIYTIKNILESIVTTPAIIDATEYLTVLPIPLAICNKLPDKTQASTQRSTIHLNGIVTKLVKIAYKILKIKELIPNIIKLLVIKLLVSLLPLFLSSIKYLNILISLSNVIIGTIKVT